MICFIIRPPLVGRSTHKLHFHCCKTLVRLYDDTVLGLDKEQYSEHKVAQSLIRKWRTVELHSHLAAENERFRNMKIIQCEQEFNLRLNHGLL